MFLRPPMQNIMYYLNNILTTAVENVSHGGCFSMYNFPIPADTNRRRDGNEIDLEGICHKTVV